MKIDDSLLLKLLHDAGLFLRPEALFLFLAWVAIGHGVSKQERRRPALHRFRQLFHVFRCGAEVYQHFIDIVGVEIRCILKLVHER